MKHNKLFAMLAVAAALAVSACGGNGDNPSSSAHKHSAAPDAPWQHDNNNHWKDCAANDGGKAENAKHTFGDPTDVVPATCTATGSQKVKCTVCGAEVTQTLPMIDHTWGEWEVTAEADCTNAGSRKHTCSVCGEVATEEIPATGHTWGEWVTTKEADCENDGSRKHTCTVCNAEESETVTKLGHDLELVGGETQPAAGEAAVRVYHCKRCGEEYLGFKATEVTEGSKNRLVFTPAEPAEGEEQSARFFGHPIGNDVPLNENGDPDRDNHPSIYNKNQTGDYFEYVFTLNAAQAAKLATVRCYCDAKPADYLGANGIDFWANKSGDEDWTRGMYIDDNPDHYEVDSEGKPVMVDEIGPDGQPTGQQIQKGKEITDYRYVLYVDDQIQEFDPDTKVRVPSGDPRGEYVMPYTFHLKEGKNKISLRMAGGYRSQFYNFVFRPYVEPTQITVNQDKLEMKVDETAQITSTFTELKYQSANAQIATVDENGLVKGIKAGETTITVSKDGNYKPAKLPVKINEKAGNYQVEVENGASSKDGEGNNQITFRTASGGHNSTDAFPKDAVLTLSLTAAEAGTYSMKINARKNRTGVGDDFDGKFTSAFEMKLNDNAIATDATVSSSWADVLIGNVELKAGANTLTFKALREDNPINLDYARFEKGEAVAPHEHAFGTPTAQTDEVESSIASCECGVTQIRWDAKKYNTTQSSDKVSTDQATGVSGDTNKGIKLGGDVYNKTSGTESAGTHVNYNVNVPAAKTGAKLIIRGVRNSSSAATMFSSMSGDQSPSYYQKEDGTWAKYEWRYKLFINGEEVEFTPYTSDEPQAPSKQYAEAAFPCTFDLKAGNNTIEIQKWGGYTLVITEFALEF